MKSMSMSLARTVLLLGVLLATIFGWGCCSTLCPDYCGTGCEQEPKADHWLVIHHNVIKDGGGPSSPASCQPPGAPQTDVAYLPKCLSVEKGDTIGFANYLDVAVEIDHQNTLDAPALITLAPGESVVFEVDVQGSEVGFEISTTEDHGGPDMIVAP